MTPFPWLILSLVLSPLGYFYLDLRGPDVIALVLASCAVSAALVGGVFARLTRKYHVHAVVALFLAAFLLATNVYFML
jgi:small basic protein